LKRPHDPIFTGSPERPFPSYEVVRGIQQLKEYREWFRSGENRRWFRQRYGLEGFEPRLTMIIGRRALFDPLVEARLFAGTDVTVLTYDDLSGAVRRRRTWLAR
jgi:hypothetical protein